MKKVFLFVALFAWIGFSASAQVERESTKKNDQTQSQVDGNHWIFKNGKVMEMKDGRSTEITGETQVRDVWIRPNGDVVMKDNKIVRLKEGQYVDEEGKIHNMTDKKKTEGQRMDPPKVEPPKVEPPR